MKNKLPVYLDNLELPKNNLKTKNNSYGYVSILSLLSMIITISTILTILIYRNR